MDDRSPGKWRTHPRIERARSLELGVATSGFQCEGALDLPGHPSTHWLPWQLAHRVEPIGEGAALWEQIGRAHV